MNGEVVQEARAILAHFEGHGWGRGGATAYHDQDEIDALVQHGPRMLVALRNLITEIDELHAALAARVEPESAPDEGVPVDDEQPEILAVEEAETPTPSARAANKARRR